MWNAIAYINGNKVIQVLLDATDIEQNEYICDVISYNTQIYNLLALISRIIYDHTKPYPVNSIIISKFSTISYETLKLGNVNK